MPHAILYYIIRFAPYACSTRISPSHAFPNLLNLCQFIGREIYGIYLIHSAKTIPDNSGVILCHAFLQCHERTRLHHTLNMIHTLVY